MIIIGMLLLLLVVVVVVVAILLLLQHTHSRTSYTFYWPFHSFTYYYFFMSHVYIYIYIYLWECMCLSETIFMCYHFFVKYVKFRDFICSFILEVSRAWPRFSYLSVSLSLSLFRSPTHFLLGVIVRHFDHSVGRSVGQLAIIIIS